MSTVVYVPKDERAAELGTGIGSAVGRVLQGYQQREQQKQVQQFMSAVQGAGSREKALEVVKNYSGSFRHPSDFSQAFRTVDEMWPALSTTPTKVNTYDEDTGEESPRYVPQHQLPALNDPAQVKALFGPKATTTKPDMGEFYTPGETPGSIQFTGRKPVGRRVEGEMTLPEIQEVHRVRAEGARDQAAQRSEREAAARQERFEAYLNISTRRLEAAIGRNEESGGERALARGRQMLNDAARLSVTSLNGKTLPDGTFGFDDENKSKLFNDRLAYINNLVDQDPKILTKPNAALELHQRAAKALPSVGDAPKPEPEVKAPAKKGGALSRMFGADGAAAEVVKPKSAADQPELGDFDTKLAPAEEKKFQEWKRKNAPNDSGGDYDLRGAFKDDFKPAANGHWPDKYKKPNHPTFSNESKYSQGAAAGMAGKWDGDTYVPSKARVETAGWKYEPGVYEYRVNEATGKVQRRKK